MAETPSIFQTDPASPSAPSPTPPPEPAPSKKSPLIPILGGLCLLLLLTSMVLGYLYFKAKKNEPAVPASVPGQATPTPGGSKEDGDPTPTETSSVQSNDEQRLEDVQQIEQALDDYRADNGEYPETLDVLRPDFLTSIPEDPDSPAHFYEYSRTEGEQGYVLAIWLDQIKADGSHIYNFTATELAEDFALANDQDAAAANATATVVSDDGEATPDTLPAT